MELNPNPNAANGVKKIFISEILSLVGVVVTILAAILAAIGLGAGLNGSLSSGTAALGSAGILGLVVVGIQIASLVVCIIGLVVAGKDNDTFMKALVCKVVVVALTVVGIFVNIPFGGTITDILNFGCMFFIIRAILEILPSGAISDMGNGVVVVALISLALGIIAPFLSAISILSLLLSIISTICSIVYIFLYIAFLNKAVTELRY